MNHDDRRRPPLNGEPAVLLREYLDHQRDTFRWKASGLDHAAMNRTHPPSALTVAGLIKHLAFVETYWFSEIFTGGRLMPPFDAVDWDTDRDWEFRTAADDAPGELFALYDQACTESDRILDAAVADGLDARARVVRRSQGEPVSLGWILLHLIEEYARHNGHLDLIRESIDGLTGA